MATKQAFTCNTCELVFEDSPAQRAHMRESWHVYNIKRRMAGLPPISSDEYSKNVATDLVPGKPDTLDAAYSSTATRRSPEEARVDDSAVKQGSDISPLDGDESQVNRCLFCDKAHDSMETNMEHMTSEHSLYIPEIEQLSSLGTILGYLRTVITEYGECLYCGMVKPSVDGIRQHMLDKGHCMINLEREPELLEFWDLSDSDDVDTDDEEGSTARSRRTATTGSRNASQGEFTLPSGKVVGTKGQARAARRLARRTATAAGKEASSTPGIMKDSTDDANADVDASTEVSAELVASTPKGGAGSAIAARDAAGLIGVSDLQLQSLSMVQRKTQRQQALVKALHASRARGAQLGGTHQRHYKQKMWLRDG